MNIASLGLSAIQALFHQTHNPTNTNPVEGDHDGSPKQDQVNFSAQAQFLGGQVQQGPSPFKDLATALQNGDLTAAKAAFASIEQRIQARQADRPTPQGGPKEKFVQDFAALGQALQSGDLDAAKQAFATLQEDLPSARPHHHHHHGPHPPAAPQGADSASSTANASLLSLTYTSITISGSEPDPASGGTSTTA